MKFLTEFFGSQDGFRKENGSEELDSFLLSPDWKQTYLIKTWGNRLANASQDFNATQFEWFQLTTNLAEGNVYV